jgi:hypothetical protein
VNFEGTAAIYLATNNIINGKDEANGMTLVIRCANGALLVLDRFPSRNKEEKRQMVTFLVILNEDKTIQIPHYVGFG